MLIFHILVFQAYWVLTESRIPLKPVLGGVRIVALSNSSHEQTPLFLIIVSSLVLLKIRFSRLFILMVVISLGVYQMSKGLFKI